MREQAVITHCDGHSRQPAIAEEQRELRQRDAAVVDVEGGTDDSDDVQNDEEYKPDPSDLGLRQRVIAGVYRCVRRHEDDHAPPTTEDALRLGAKYISLVDYSQGCLRLG